jgi:hypothetical protein
MAYIIPFHTHGQNSWMYEIWEGHWPCPACEPQELECKYPALAKMHIQQPRYTPEEHLLNINEENLGLRTVCGSITLYHLLILTLLSR